MQNRTRHRISLDALKVFEAAARHRSFTLAASELLVTQVAVSKRIKTLEDQLGFDLFTRSGRRISLTEKGERLATRVETALSYLEEELEFLRPGSDAGQVTISASASVSQLWLSQRLYRITEANPGLKITLNTTDRITDLENTTASLSILYSNGGHPDWTLTPLFPEELIPVAAPVYIEKRFPGRDAKGLVPADILQTDCIDYQRANANWVTLRMWFNRFLPGVTAPEMAVTFSNYGSAIEAAVKGRGVVLGSRHMLADLLAAGALVTLTQHVMATEKGYYLGLPNNRPVTENTLTAWRALQED